MPSRIRGPFLYVILPCLCFLAGFLCCAWLDDLDTRDRNAATLAAALPPQTTAIVDAGSTEELDAGTSYEEEAGHDLFKGICDVCVKEYALKLKHRSMARGLRVLCLNGPARHKDAAAECQGLELLRSLYPDGGLEDDDAGAEGDDPILDW